MSESLQIDRDGRLLLLTLNRPEKRNALNLELCGALVDVVEAAGRDDSVGAILLRGAGKAFSAGMDLVEMLEPGPDSIDRVHEALFTLGLRMTKPLVAAVHGPALAGGTGLVANCHIAIAAEEATFGLTEIRLGLWPFVIFRTVAAALGERRATELALTGRTFGALEAQQCGLVQHVVPAGELEVRARAIAASLAVSSRTAQAAGLQFVQEIRGKSWQEAGEIARRIRDRVFATPDFQEGIHAFHEKRKPQWPSIST